MKNALIYPLGATSACRFASSFLKTEGIALTDHPSPEVTHLLLDAPSFSSPGILRSGDDISRILPMLPPNITIIGGNLDDPILDTYSKLDVLQDPLYLAKNALITAECALKVAFSHMDFTFTDSSALILGWGRIGKCLAKLLRGLGCDVVVAARKDTDRAMLQALGYKAVNYPEIKAFLPKIRLLFNTVPEALLSFDDAHSYRQCVKIDLASKPGIAGDDVIIARGLPGIYAPESSGKLLAQTIIRLSEEANL